MKLLAKFALVTVAVAVAGGAKLYANSADSVATSPLLPQALAQRAQIDDDLKTVQQLQLTARKAKDLIKLNCLNDKLVQMKPEVNIAEHAQSDLMMGSPEAQQASLGTILRAAANVHALREAAQQCIGKPTLATESYNDYSHPEIVDQPPALGGNGDIEPPAYASPVN